MPRARSIPEPEPADKPSLPRRSRRWLARELRWMRPRAEASAAACRAERYRKRFDSWAHLCVLLFDGLTASPSLRQSYAGIAQSAGLLRLAGLDAGPGGRPGVSFSQLADSSHTRPAEFAAGLLPPLIERVRAGGEARDLPRGLAGMPLLDSTFLRVSLRLAPWLPGGTGGGGVSAVRAQVEYGPALDLPEHVLVGTTDRNDCRGLDEAILDDPGRLGELAGRTLAFDLGFYLGFYSHRRMGRLLEAGVHVVTRLHRQAEVGAPEAAPVQGRLDGVDAGRVEVVSDERATLGSPNNRAGAVLPGMRIVRAVVPPTARAARLGKGPVEYELVTDRWDLEAEEVARAYLWRWQIELLFRWLKSHIRLRKLLGYSENAIRLSVWLALIVHLLTLLAARALGYARRSPSLLRQLGYALLLLDPDDPDEPGPPTQAPLPGFDLRPAPT